MLDETVEKVLADIEQLSSEQQREALQHLEKKVNGKRLPRPSLTSKAVQRTNELPQLTFTPRIIGEAPLQKIVRKSMSGWNSTVKNLLING